MPETFDISVVVCTYNRCALLERALRSLLALEGASSFRHEIVVVDDQSTDATQEVVASLAATSPTPLRAVPAAGRGVAPARNAGVAAARGRFVAFFDDDQLADKHWLLELWRLQQETGADCVGGTRALLLEETPPLPLPRITRLVLGEIPAEGVRRPYGRSGLLCTGNMMLSRSVFEEIGGFDESLLEGGEDTDLFRRMRKARLNCWYTPDALVHHLIPGYRLTEDYLRRTAVRGGQTYAKRDLAELGFCRAFAIAFLRLVHGLSVHGLFLFLAQLSGNRAAAISRRCHAARSSAYARTVLASVLGENEITRNAEVTPFRSERVLFSSPEQPET